MDENKDRSGEHQHQPGYRSRQVPGGEGQFFSNDLTEKIEAYHWLSSFANQPELTEAAAKIRKSVEVDTWLRYRLSFGMPDVEDSTEIWRQHSLNVLAMEALIQYELNLMFGTVGKHPSLGGPPLTVAALDTDPAGALKRVVAQLTDRKSVV